MLGLLKVSVSAMLATVRCSDIYCDIPTWVTPVSMLRFGDCRGVQPLRTGRLVYSLLIVQIWATCRQGVTQIGWPGVERFATFWGIHGEFGTT